jgi:hypothetical protein
MTWTRPPGSRRKSRTLSDGRKPCLVCGRLFAWKRTIAQPDTCCSTTCLSVYHTREASRAKDH